MLLLLLLFRYTKRVYKTSSRHCRSALSDANGVFMQQHYARCVIAQNAKGVSAARLTLTHTLNIYGGRFDGILGVRDVSVMKIK